MATQATMGALAAGLELLTVAGVVQLWHVYVFAFLFGSAAAFDAPARQTFAGEQAKDWAGVAGAGVLKLDPTNKANGPEITSLLEVWIENGMCVLVEGGGGEAREENLRRSRSADQ